MRNLTFNVMESILAHPLGHCRRHAGPDGPDRGQRPFTARPAALHRHSRRAAPAAGGWGVRIALRGLPQSRYASIMCSNPEERIAAIERAIDELAAEAAAAYARPRRPAPGQGDGHGDGQADPIVTRLAELWALLAELDPDVAGRIPRYQA